MSSFPTFTGFFKDARWSLETLEVIVAEKRKVFLSRGTTCVKRFGKTFFHGGRMPKIEAADSNIRWQQRLKSENGRTPSLSSWKIKL